ncbi:MAG TPA: hypothetical protein VJ672_16730 [Gemmatimonadaceae bacterium]|nr:hypothetical protein [Gemmatimonadaceae bacterium]
MRTIGCISVVVAALTFHGCASRGNETVSGSRRLITSQEIEQSRAPNAYAVIERLRGEFLAPRQNPRLPRPGDTAYRSEPIFPTVYVDGMAYGHMYSLRNIPASEVSQIRFLTASQAQQKYGSGHPVGIIEVETKR